MTPDILGIDGILGECDDKTFLKLYNEEKRKRDIAKDAKRPFAKYQLKMNELLHWRIKK